jgi:hypothetical protein
MPPSTTPRILPAVVVATVLTESVRASSSGRRIADAAAAPKRSDLRRVRRCMGEGDGLKKGYGPFFRPSTEKGAVPLFQALVRK